ncbi:MAG: haloacid dehalogenase type II, partial [Thermomicrobiaceae bacterium]|nr:haloacid dehalogenase type II [Thermomicrobiaceae bacterium]
MPLDRIDAIAFDVYGTLVDVTSLAARAQALGLPASALVATWRAKQLEYSFVRTLTGDYVDFWQVTRDALDYACAALGVDLADDARERLCREWLALDPFPEVPQALAALGSRPLVVLSNGSPAMLDPLLERSGLRERFREVLS